MNYTIKTILCLILTQITFAQVGISNEEPKATLDIVGKPTELATPDVVIVPRISRQQLVAKTGYTAAQTGTIVYVTDLTGSTNLTTSKISEVGYYYFDGAQWKSMNSTAKFVYGDVKQGFQTVDHDGWIKLNGRLISSLTSAQQTKASNLGFGTNLPDATDKVLKQKSNVNTTGGANSVTIAKANLPDYYLPVALKANDGGHPAYDPRAFHSDLINSLGGSQQATTDRTPDRTAETGIVRSGGSGTVLGIENSYLSINVFIYLGE